MKQNVFVYFLSQNIENNGKVLFVEPKLAQFVVENRSLAVSFNFCGQYDKNDGQKELRAKNYKYIYGCQDKHLDIRENISCIKITLKLFFMKII